MNPFLSVLSVVCGGLLTSGAVCAAVPGVVCAEVDFTDSLRIWDGFGVNYVETSQTFDYKQYAQDYGGFSRLSEKDKQEIIDLTFGDDGLKPSIVKMFLDPLHQEYENGPYDHETTTRNMRYFVKQGNRLTQQRGERLSIVTTLYSPPAYILKQKQLRGRDIDMDKLSCMTDYMADWARYLIEEEHLPVDYISLHNEGESWRRWPVDGGADELMDKSGHDYNVYMDPQTVVATINSLRKSLDRMGLNRVGISNGETTNWYRLGAWDYARTLARNPEALENLSLITSHGFYVGVLDSPRWFAPHSNEGVELLRKYRPGLHAWTTSMAWNVSERDCKEGEMTRSFVSNAIFLKEIHGNIYEAHCNAIIPWALIQNASHWNKPDPNPGCAFRVYDDGSWEVRKGYYYFKQISRVGRPGMSVVYTSANDSEIALIGFGSNQTQNPNAFVAVNWGQETFDLKIKIVGGHSTSYEAYRTTGSETYVPYETARQKYPDGENCRQLPDFRVEDGYIHYEIPPMSVTTFIEK